MRTELAAQFKNALALSMLLHMAMFTLAVLIAAQWYSKRDKEYIAVELIRPSGGGQRMSAQAHHPHEVRPQKELKPQPEAKQDLPADDVMGLVNKIPESSPDAPSPVQTGSQPYDGPSGPEREGTGYHYSQRVSRVPSFKVQKKPVYPQSERTAGREARVVVEVFISEYGAVDRVTVIKSGGPLFDHAVVTAAKDSSFEPGYLDGKPVPVRVQIPYVFKLR